MLKFRIRFTHDHADKYEEKEFETIQKALEYCWSIIKDEDKIYESDNELEEIIISKPHKRVYNDHGFVYVLETDWDYNLEIYDTYRE